MGGLLAFAVLAGADPRCTFVVADAQALFGDVSLGGRVFVAVRRGEVAACVALDETQCFDGIRDLRKLAARGELAALADVEAEGGVQVIRSVRLFRTAAWDQASGWVAGQSRGDMAPQAASWSAHVTLASSGRPALPMPVGMRPEGTGAPCELVIRGVIGAGRYSGAEVAEHIRDAAGRTILLDIDSEGGSTVDGMMIYRALAAHRCAVYATITQAQSMAAIIALAADTRLIASDGVMLLHKPHLSTVAAEAADLRTVADRLDSLTDEFAGIVAARCDVSLGIAHCWIEAGERLTAAQAVAGGLAHGIADDVAPRTPQARRATFAPIAAPYRSFRPASAPPPLYGHGHRYRAGQRVRFNGRVYVATAATFGAPGLTPDRDPERWTAG